MRIDAGMAKEHFEQLGASIDLERMLAFVRHQCADINSKVLFVRQGRHQRHQQPIVLGWLMQIGGHFKDRSHLFGYAVLGVVILKRHFVDQILVVPFLVAIVIVCVIRPVIVFGHEMKLLVSIQIPHVDLLYGDRSVYTL